MTGGLQRPSSQRPPSVPTPSELWDRGAATRALDELFSLTLRYRKISSYLQLMHFVARFRFYSPFNAMLINMQMPGALYVATPHRWRDQYKREIAPGERPIVILRPMGPVMFVFDVSQTVPMDGAPPLPRDVEKPFEVRSGRIGHQLDRMIDNAKRDGIRITMTAEGSQSAGSIRLLSDFRGSQRVWAGMDEKREPTFVNIRVRYDLLVNRTLGREAQFATIVHELAHLYCGHLGSPNPRWWPDRRGLDHGCREFEAESTTYLVCSRRGIDNPSAQYLAGYVNTSGEVPPISLDCVMKTAGLIESMGSNRLKPRKSGTSPLQT